MELIGTNCYVFKKKLNSINKFCIRIINNSGVWVFFFDTILIKGLGKTVISSSDQRTTLFPCT